MAGDYRFVFADLVTGQLLEELPLSGVSLGRQLGGGGEFSASLVLTSDLMKLRPWEVTAPAKRMVWTVRDGVPIGCHVIWTRRWSPSSRTMSLGGAEVWSVLRKRDVLKTVSFSNFDTGVMAGQLVTGAQDEWGAQLNITADGSSSGVKVSRTIYASEHRKVADEVDQLSVMGDGFSFDLRPWADGDVYRLQFRVNPGASGGLAASWPGNIRDFELISDGSSTVTALTVLGGGDLASLGVAQGRTVDPGALDDGYPILDGAISAPSVTNASARGEFARGMLQMTSRGVEWGQLSISPHDPPLGSYGPGDRVRIVVSDPERLGPTESSDRVVTLTGLTVSPQTESTEETVSWSVATSVGGL